MEFRRVLFRSRISHPHETETREYDKHKRLRQRTVSRAAAGTDSLRYTESFEYDAAHRLRRHHLPEGGSLEYRWNLQGRLAAIHWHDAQAQTHTIIDSEPDRSEERRVGKECVKTYRSRGSPYQ